MSSKTQTAARLNRLTGRSICSSSYGDLSIPLFGSYHRLLGGQSMSDRPTCRNQSAGGRSRPTAGHHHSWPRQVSFEEFRSLCSPIRLSRAGWQQPSIVAGMTTILGVFLACTAAYAPSPASLPRPAGGLRPSLVVADVSGHDESSPVHHHVQFGLGLDVHAHVGSALHRLTAIPFCVWMMKRIFRHHSQGARKEIGRSTARRQETIFSASCCSLAKPAVAVTGRSYLS